MQFGDYTVIKELSSDPAGIRYHVRARRSNREGVVRLLPEQTDNGPLTREVFFREAAELVKLRHPRLVSVLNFGETKGRFWLRSEPHGEVGNGGSLSLGQFFGITTVDFNFPDFFCESVIEGLMYLHENGCFHGSLCAETIAGDFSKDWHQVSLTDFGLYRFGLRAKAFSEHDLSLMVQAPETKSSPFDYWNTESISAGAAEDIRDLAAITANRRFSYYLDPRPLSESLEDYFQRTGVDHRFWLPRALGLDPGGKFRSVRELRAALPPSARVVGESDEPLTVNAPGGVSAPAESPPRPVVETPEVGKNFGPFGVESVLGRGGMGEVYGVRLLSLGTRHAIKLMHPEMLRQSGALEAFRREAELMARLRHPGIVRVDDFGETGGRRWFRMEWIEGGSLEKALRGAGGPLPVGTARPLLLKILEALAYAHDAGVTHRDLKPGNVLLDSPLSLDGDGPCPQPLITDFGIFELAGEKAMQRGGEGLMEASVPLEFCTAWGQGLGADNTCIRSVAGTIAYMSPEQREGQATDPRSDLYSLALIAYRMLTGQKTFGMQLPSEVNPQLNAAWDAWFKRALMPEPHQRFQSAREMAEAMPLPKNAKVKRFTFTSKRLPPWILSRLNPMKSVVPWMVCGIICSLYLWSLWMRTESHFIAISAGFLLSLILGVIMGAFLHSLLVVLPMTYFRPSENPEDPHADFVPDERMAERKLTTIESKDLRCEAHFTVASSTGSLPQGGENEDRSDLRKEGFNLMFGALVTACMGLGLLALLRVVESRLLFIPGFALLLISLVNFFKGVGLVAFRKADTGIVLAIYFFLCFFGALIFWLIFKG